MGFSFFISPISINNKALIFLILITKASIIVFRSFHNFLSVTFYEQVFDILIMKLLFLKGILSVCAIINLPKYITFAFFCMDLMWWEGSEFVCRRVGLLFFCVGSLEMDWGFLNYGHMRELLFEDPNLIALKFFDDFWSLIFVDMKISPALIFGERPVPKERFWIEMLSYHNWV